MTDNHDRPERVRVLYSDLLGLTHGKTVPADRADHPTHYALTVMCQGLDLEFIELDGYSTAAGFPDMEARLDPATVRPGWPSGLEATDAPVDLIGFAELFHTDGSPLALDVRHALTSAASAWEDETGSRVQLGFEMEFYLLAGADPSAGRLPVPWHRVYGTGPGADPSGLLAAIAVAADRAELRLEGVNAEFHPSQAEAALRHRDAGPAADDALLFRELVREVALSRGAGATFTARPFADAIGNGMHINLSGCTARGDNIFADPADPDGISPMCRQAVAGMLHHHQAMAAFLAPTVNSYKRLRPNLLSGYWANWGFDNRLTSVRIPGQRGGATRIEHRTPDGTASPHLAAAVIIAAALHGVREGMSPPQPQHGDVPEPGPGAQPVGHTPHSLDAALDALELDVELTTLLGPTLVGAFIDIKRAELERWHTAVTDWETATYGRVY